MRVWIEQGEKHFQVKILILNIVFTSPELKYYEAKRLKCGIRSETMQGVKK